MKLFTIGPTQMYQRTLDLRSRQIPYFRTATFSDLMLDTDLRLKALLKTKQTSKTVYLTASGTGAMEATVMNCFSSADRLLVIDGRESDAERILVYNIGIAMHDLYFAAKIFKRCADIPDDLYFKDPAEKFWV